MDPSIFEFDWNPMGIECENAAIRITSARKIHSTVGIDRQVLLRKLDHNLGFRVASRREVAILVNRVQHPSRKVISAQERYILPESDSLIHRGTGRFDLRETSLDRSPIPIPGLALRLEAAGRSRGVSRLILCCGNVDHAEDATSTGNGSHELGGPSAHPRAEEISESIVVHIFLYTRNALVYGRSESGT